MSEELYEQDEMKYKRKKPSNTSRSYKKSDHKHDYEKCLIRSHSDYYGENKEHYHLGRVCRICGSTKIDQFMITKLLENRRYLCLRNEEILADYKDLRIVDIGNL